jgi:hypothetical protein
MTISSCCRLHGVHNRRCGPGGALSLDIARSHTPQHQPGREAMASRGVASCQALPGTQRARRSVQ